MRRSNMARSCMGVCTCVECKFVFVVILIDYLLFIDSRFTTFSKRKVQFGQSSGKTIWQDFKGQVRITPAANSTVRCSKLVVSNSKLGSKGCWKGPTRAVFETDTAHLVIPRFQKPMALCWTTPVLQAVGRSRHSSLHEHQVVLHEIATMLPNVVNEIIKIP